MLSFTSRELRWCPSNIWDAGSAAAFAKAAAPAVATSSWSVSKSQGYQDGEGIPFEFLNQIVERIAASVDVPVWADFEGGYTEDDGKLAENISRLLDTGAIGINFEVRVVKGYGLHPIDRQADRLAAIRKAADDRGFRCSSTRGQTCFSGKATTPSR